MQRMLPDLIQINLDTQNADTLSPLPLPWQKSTTHEDLVI
jgi:hypothetical protein